MRNVTHGEYKRKEVRSKAQPRHYDSDALRQAAYRQRTAQARAAQLATKGIPNLPMPSNIPANQRWNALWEQARWALDTMESEMQTYAQSRSPPWQESEKGEGFQERTEVVTEPCATMEQMHNDFFV